MLKKKRCLTCGRPAKPMSFFCGVHRAVDSSTPNTFTIMLVCLGIICLICFLAWVTVSNFNSMAETIYDSGNLHMETLGEYKWDY